MRREEKKLDVPSDTDLRILTQIVESMGWEKEDQVNGDEEWDYSGFVKRGGNIFALLNPNKDKSLDEIEKVASHKGILPTIEVTWQTLRDEWENATTCKEQIKCIAKYLGLEREEIKDVLTINIEEELSDLEETLVKEKIDQFGIDYSFSSGDDELLIIFSERISDNIKEIIKSEMNINIDYDDYSPKLNFVVDRDYYKLQELINSLSSKFDSNLIRIRKYGENKFHVKVLETQKSIYETLLLRDEFDDQESRLKKDWARFGNKIECDWLPSFYNGYKASEWRTIEDQEEWWSGGNREGEDKNGN